MNNRRAFLSQLAGFSLGAAAARLLAGSPSKAFAAAPEAGSGLTAHGGSLISLPAPDMKGGLPLMQALAMRRSTRSFSGSDLRVEQISNILWASVGVNRPDGKRTIPTALNKRNITVYAAMGIGLWRYLPEKHALQKESDVDLRDKLGGAPLTLGYAAQGKFGGLHAGSAYQNVGLYCASAGLGNVVKYSGVKQMAEELALADDYELLIVQSIGMPA